jgi:hypothetical protein
VPASCSRSSCRHSFMSLRSAHHGKSPSRWCSLRHRSVTPTALRGRCAEIHSVHTSHCSVHVFDASFVEHNYPKTARISFVI